MAITIKQRAFAGLWFMAAAALLVVPMSTSAAGDPSLFLYSLIWLLFSPLLISGLVGALLGASILDAQRIRSGWRAALRGVLIAVIAYLLYAIVLSAREGYAHQGPFSSGEEFGRTLIMVLIWGALLFGWVGAIVGALAGWALHLISASRTR